MHFRAAKRKGTNKNAKGVENSKKCPTIQKDVIFKPPKDSKFTRKNQNFINRENEIEFKVRIPGNFLTPGSYSWNICINLPNVEIFDMHEDVLPFSIIDTGSKFAMYSGQNYGTVFAQYSIELD